METGDADGRDFLSEGLAAPPENGLDFGQISSNSGPLEEVRAGTDGSPEQRSNDLGQSAPEALPAPGILQAPPAEGGLLQLLQGGSADDGEPNVDLCGLPPPGSLLFGQDTEVEPVTEPLVDSMDLEGASRDTGVDPALLQEGDAANSQFLADGSVPLATLDAHAGPRCNL